MIPTLVLTRSRASPLRGASQSIDATIGIYLLPQDIATCLFLLSWRVNYSLLQDTSLSYVGDRALENKRLLDEFYFKSYFLLVFV